MAAAYSITLYYFNQKLDISKRTRFILAITRFIIVLIFGFLIFAPLIKNLNTELSKPTVSILVDNSQSIGFKQDTTELIKNWNKNLEFAKEQLGENFNVEYFTFGDKFERNGKIDFDEKTTNISRSIMEVGRLNKHKNLGMLVIASDGIYNMGSNPIYALEKIGVPTATIAFGDTNKFKDLRISRLAHNDFAFKGDIYPLEVEVEAVKCLGENSKIELLANGKIIDSREISINSNNQIRKFNFAVKAEDAGVIKHEIKLQVVDGEANKANNSTEFFIEIFETKRKILLVHDGTSPEIGTLKRAINTSKNYEFIQKHFSEISNVKGYDLVIYHDLLQNTNNLSRIQNLLASDVPCLIIASGKTDVNTLNALKLGISIQSTKKMSNEVTPEINTGFALFQIDEKLKLRISDFSPVNAPFGKYSLSSDIEVLVKQRIGNVSTDYPIVAMTKSRNIPVGFIFGDGFWNWPLLENLKYKNQETFDYIISQTIKYLSINIKRDRFEVKHKNIYDENESIIFDASILDKAFEPLKNADIKLDITDENGKTFNFAFSKNGSNYTLDAGQINSGTYTFAARVKTADSLFTRKGTFHVKAIELEFSNTTANHNLLNIMAQSHDSRLYKFSEFEQLINDIKNRKDIKSIEHAHYNYTDLIDLKWILALVILLLTAEWFTRKYLGGY